MSDPLRPEGSRAWTSISGKRVQFLMRVDHDEGSYEVQFKRFLGRAGWQDIRASTQHEARTRYRARKVNWS